jgi:peptidoglycan/LPS O-acetylase OafA/YrhL
MAQETALAVGDGGLPAADGVRRPLRLSNLRLSNLRLPTRGRRRPAVTLDPRRNSLNLIRLVLASAVLVAHTVPLSGRGEGPTWAGEGLGGWAVIGFFVLSGYLITGSRLRSDGGRYLINRVVRIFPGFLVSLVVVAFAFAPVAYLVERGSLEGFLTTPTTPLAHLFDNALLRMDDYSVAGTLASAPYPGVWNGSLWSLYFEFLCYIVVGVVAVVPVVRRRAWPIVTLFLLSVLVHATMPVVSVYLGGNGEFVLLMRLLPYFLGGAVLFVLKDRCPLRWSLAVPALVLALGAIAWQPAWGGQLAAPLFAYVLLWLGAVLPSPRAVVEHDVSFGVYVYAFPVSQLLVLFGGHTHGLLLFNVLVVAATLVFATLSWLYVERPARDAVAAQGRRARATRVPEPVPAPAGSPENGVSVRV